jgi:hypothetical protein
MHKLDMDVDHNGEVFTVTVTVTYCKMKWTLSPIPLHATNSDTARREAQTELINLRKRYV